jgi:hypothetical protein
MKKEEMTFPSSFSIATFLTDRQRARGHESAGWARPRLKTEKY